MAGLDGEQWRQALSAVRKTRIMLSIRLPVNLIDTVCTTSFLGPTIVTQLMISLGNSPLSSIMQTMRLLINCMFALLTLASSIPAAKRGDCACTNGPDTRNCWGPGFDISVNLYNRFPDTGKIVHVTGYSRPDLKSLRLILAR